MIYFAQKLGLPLAVFW